MIVEIDSLAYHSAPQKCDEIRVDSSCKTCIRLNIDCLGWGVKRPEWMRVSTLILHASVSTDPNSLSHPYFYYVGQATSPGIPCQNHRQTPP